MASKKRYDINIENAEKVFFTSDTHFNHFNIIGSCGRPFNDENEMNEVLINNWNSVVDEESTVFHLGDFAWGNFKKWKEVCDKLNGHIILIRGNHDWKNGPQNEEQENELFDFVTQQMYMRIEGRQVLLNHNPFLCYGGVYRDAKDVVYQLYGHVHSGQFSKKGMDIPRIVYAFPTQYDVGVDNNNFTPISWKEVNEKIQKQMKESDMFKESDEVGKEKELKKQILP